MTEATQFLLTVLVPATARLLCSMPPTALAKVRLHGGEAYVRATPSYPAVVISCWCCCCWSCRRSCWLFAGVFYLLTHFFMCPDIAGRLVHEASLRDLAHGRGRKTVKLIAALLCYEVALLKLSRLAFRDRILQKRKQRVSG